MCARSDTDTRASGADLSREEELMISRKDKASHRYSWTDAIALAILAAIALGIAGFLLRDDVFLYGDHPGHYWLVWYTLNVAVPLHHRLIDWIPYWYAGYPELQFTPPGYVLLAWLLNLFTLGKLSTAFIYEIVVFVGYVLPGFTFYYAVRHLRFDRRAAFLAGLIALVFPAFFDGATSLFIGMVGSRIGFALNALVFALTLEWLERHDCQYGWMAILALAAVILVHPYHAIGILLALVFYTLFRPLPLVSSSIRLLLLIASAFAIDAFWLLPLFARSSIEMIPVIRSTLDQTLRVMLDGMLLPYVLLALPMLLAVRREADRGKRAIVLALFGLALVSAVVMAGAHVILVNQFHVYSIDPIRLIGEYYLAWIWLAALGSAEISRQVENLPFVTKRFGGVAGWAVMACLAAALAVPFVQSASYYQPKPGGEPRFLSQAIQDYDLEEFWATLRDTPGRVLFTFYSTELHAQGNETFPTTLSALTPLFSGKAIVGGTYTAWSPIAAHLWAGSTRPPVLWGLSQDQQDQSLFGIKLGELSDEQLADYCQRLNISTIVASVDSYQTRTFLDGSPRFQSYYNNGLYFVYRMKNLPSSWIQSDTADVELVSLSDDRIELLVHSAQPNAHVRIKMHAYPTWHAYVGQTTLPLTSDDLTLMDLRLPPGENYVVTLRYESGAPEEIGEGVSVASLLLFSLAGALGVVIRRKHTALSGTLE